MQVAEKFAEVPNWMRSALGLPQKGKKPRGGLPLEVEAIVDEVRENASLAQGYARLAANMGARTYSNPT